MPQETVYQHHTKEDAVPSTVGNARLTLITQMFNNT